jgi:hypothetical protein
MSVVKPDPKPVKLICGLLFNSQADLDAVDRELESRFGPIDSRSPIFDFAFTDYYTAEMGEGLRKRFCAFDDLIIPDALPEIKNAAIEIESGFTASGARMINVDPGYLEESKLVLASTKNFSHRIYLRDSIWAEVTLRFIRGQFVKHDWTYPDYCQELAIEFLNNVRDNYRKQLRALGL